jgi:site-specific recombinase XerD
MRKTNRNISIPESDVVKSMINRKVDILMKTYKKIPQEKYVFNILNNDIANMSPMDALNAISSKTAMINKRLKKIAEMANISKNLSTHVGRHSFATLLKTKKVDTYIIKELLGHQDIRTTEIYVKVMDSTKNEAINHLN